jgi:predicted glycosyl hydrolase (DUF1957 family)
MKGEAMSKDTQRFFEQLKSGEQPTLIEAVKEAASLMKDIGGEIWDGMKPMFDHGRTEIAAALFSGHGHVMYMKGQESIEQGLDQGQVKETPEQQRDDGREM